MNSETAAGRADRGCSDRWLAAHDRAVRDAALTEAAKLVETLYDSPAPRGRESAWVVAARAAAAIRHLQEGGSHE